MNSDLETSDLKLKNIQSNNFSELNRFCHAMSDGVRSRIIDMLMSGDSLPASLIANELRMSPQATRFHLRILEDANLIVARSCGRHRYYEIESCCTAERIEGIFGIVGSPASGANRFSPEFSEIRCCYKHLGGSIAVSIAHAMQGNGFLSQINDDYKLEPKGQIFFDKLGVSYKKNSNGEVMTRRCIDVTHRRGHLGGSLGASLLTWMFDNGWVRKKPGMRTLCISTNGRTNIMKLLEGIETGAPKFINQVV